MPKTIFLLDNGHGYNTPGKRSPKLDDGRELQEWKWVRDVVAIIASECALLGIKHHILVPETHDVSLGERCRRANIYVPPKGYRKVLISVHANAAGDGINWHDAKGFEAFTTTGVTGSDTVATEILKQLKVQFPDRKFRFDTTDGDTDKESNFYILKHTDCPAVLTENGFYTNKEETEEMLTEEFKKKVARAHVDAFLALDK